MKRQDILERPVYTMKTLKPQRLSVSDFIVSFQSQSLPEGGEEPVKPDRTR